MSQKRLPGGPRTNGNHADRLMQHGLPASVRFPNGQHFGNRLATALMGRIPKGQLRASTSQFFENGSSR